jgi:hypothetical protein
VRECSAVMPEQMERLPAVRTRAPDADELLPGVSSERTVLLAQFVEVKALLRTHVPVVTLDLLELPLTPARSHLRNVPITATDRLLSR